jgi:glyoxalase family protein
VGQRGAGQVTATSFSVPAGSLDAWKARLRALDVACIDLEPRFGEGAIRFSDPSGLRFELIANDRDARAPWTGAVGAGIAIRGLHSVTMKVRDPRGTLDLMTRLFGYEIVNEAAGRIRLAIGGDAPGRAIDIACDRNARPMANGLGTVHHVAMAVPTEAAQLEFRTELIRYGCRVTEVRDRCYFKSIYFREPGGVLFEIATLAPGFTVDEEPMTLGRTLKLPPWEERHRSDIEASLVPINC